MEVKKGLLYTKEHVWILPEDDVLLIGITDFAQHSMGELVFADLPEVGESIEEGEAFGSVESVKAISELFMPISGEVLEINEEASENPEMVNQDPYGTWLIKVKADDFDDVSELMSAEAYEYFLSEENP